MRVNQAIADGSLFENPALVGAFERAKARGGRVHLLGLVSYGGVHSHIDHVRALLELARRQGMEDQTFIHAFTDGRDVSPTSAADDLGELPVERIATVVGRYYAMDRDDAGSGRRRRSALSSGPTGSPPEINRGNSPKLRRGSDRRVHRADRDRGPAAPGARGRGHLLQLPARPRQAVDAEASGLRFDLTTMTNYRDDFDVPVAFAEQEVTDTVAEVLSEHGVPQLHVAETEKYAHVTYFFNGGREGVARETRILVPSPRDVPSYDHKPEMSARGVTDRRGCHRLRRVRIRRPQLRQSRHGRAHGIDPGHGARCRDRRRVPGPSGRRRHRKAESRSSRPTTETRNRCSPTTHATYGTYVEPCAVSHNGSRRFTPRRRGAERPRADGAGPAWNYKTRP